MSSSIKYEAFKDSVPVKPAEGIYLQIGGDEKVILDLIVIAIRMLSPNLIML